MYENGQGHLTLFCIVFVWLRGRPTSVRSHCTDLWFMYQNRLGPSGGIYYPNFVPCFVYHQLNEVAFVSALWMVSSESWKKSFIPTNMHTTVRCIMHVTTDRITVFMAEESMTSWHLDNISGEKTLLCIFKVRK